MTQINLPLSDLGQLGQPAADVGNNLINKFSSAIGWLVTPKGTKPFQLEAQKSIIAEIADRKDINPIERAAIISNWNKTIKEYTNQHDILEIAIAHLEPTAHPESLDDEWLQFFADKSRLVSKEETKLIWGKILANECNHPDSISKSLINTLSQIDPKAALAFNQLASHIVIDKADNTPVPIIPWNENMDYFGSVGLEFTTFLELQRHSLITFNSLSGYAISEHSLSALYFDTNLQFTTQNASLLIGNVLLTQDGIQLFNVITKEKSAHFIDIINDYFVNQNVKITIE